MGGNRFADSLKLNDLTLYDAKPLRHLGPLGADRFPVLYDLRHECHTMTAMGAILEGVPYPLRAMIMTGANPALTNPNTARVREALTALDLLVVRDLFMSETRRTGATTSCRPPPSSSGPSCTPMPSTRS